MDNLTATQFKIYANDIVGVWYNDVPDDVMIFSFLYDFIQYADLLIIDKGIRRKASYCIHNMSDIDWFLVIRDKDVSKTIFYHIEFLSPDAFIMTSSELEVKMYQRKIDYAFVHSILDKVY